MRAGPIRPEPERYPPCRAILWLPWQEVHVTVAELACEDVAEPLCSNHRATSFSG